MLNAGEVWGSIYLSYALDMKRCPIMVLRHWSSDNSGTGCLKINFTSACKTATFKKTF